MCDLIENVRKAHDTESSVEYIHAQRRIATRCNDTARKSLEDLRDRSPRTCVYTRARYRCTQEAFRRVCGCQRGANADRTNVLPLMRLLISLVKLQGSYVRALRRDTRLRKLQSRAQRPIAHLTAIYPCLEPANKLAGARYCPQRQTNRGNIVG